MVVKQPGGKRHRNGGVAWRRRRWRKKWRGRRKSAKAAAESVENSGVNGEWRHISGGIAAAAGEWRQSVIWHRAKRTAHGGAWRRASLMAALSKKIAIGFFFFFFCLLAYICAHYRHSLTLLHCLFASRMFEIYQAV
jgi:hypothetical protein